MPNVFSVPIFFIVFRETLEAAIIVSVLLGLVEQIVTEDSNRRLGTSSPSTNSDEKRDPNSPDPDSEEEKQRRHRLVKKLRWQIFLGSAVGFIIALAIGAAFIAVWFTKASDLWSKSEELWEGMCCLPVLFPTLSLTKLIFQGIFELVASLIIFIMGITMLKMDRSKAKWRVKLERAFEGQRAYLGDPRYFYLFSPSNLALTTYLAPQRPTEGLSLANGSSSSYPSLPSCERVWKL